MTEPTAPAGWYPQPDGSLRYWDGTVWTAHVQPPAGPAKPRAYEGIRWLGIRWGRNGRPGIHIAMAASFALLAIVQGLNAARGASLAWVHAAVSAGAVLVVVASAIEAHFAARVLREQA